MSFIIRATHNFALHCVGFSATAQLDETRRSRARVRGFDVTSLHSTESKAVANQLSMVKVANGMQNLRMCQISQCDTYWMKNTEACPGPVPSQRVYHACALHLTSAYRVDLFGRLFILAETTSLTMAPLRTLYIVIGREANSFTTFDSFSLFLHNIGKINADCIGVVRTAFGDDVIDRIHCHVLFRDLNRLR